MEAPLPETIRRRRPWQDLPSELLGLVLQRVPTHTDRVRLRAVCRSWRAGARMQTQLPPLQPWCVLHDGTCFSLPDGAVHRISVPDDVARCVSTGSMLYLVHFDGRCSLMNPLSRETTLQYIPQTLWYRLSTPWILIASRLRKAVLMPDHNVIAVRTVQSEDITISTCGPRRSTVDMTWRPTEGMVRDIALFQGKLYALTTTCTDKRRRNLYVLDVAGSDEKAGIQCILNTPKDDADSSYYYKDMYYYLVASGDRLLMVEQGITSSNSAWFEVFEATRLSSGRGWWRKIDTLMGRALFLSEGCSESLPANKSRCIGPEEDCIYFHCSRSHNTRELCSGVYNMRNRSMSMFHQWMMGRRDGPWSPTWLFPAGT